MRTSPRVIWRIVLRMTALRVSGCTCAQSLGPYALAGSQSWTHPSRRGMAASARECTEIMEGRRDGQKGVEQRCRGKGRCLLVDARTADTSPGVGSCRSLSASLVLQSIVIPATLTLTVPNGGGGGDSEVRSVGLGSAFCALT